MLRLVLVLCGAVVACADAGADAGVGTGAAIYASKCAQCHEGASGQVPPLASLQRLPAAGIVRSLSSGTMSFIGASLSAEERQAVAAFIGAGTPAAPAATGAVACASPKPFPADPLAGAYWNGWGVDSANTRFQPAEMSRLDAADVPALELEWAFAFPGETIMAAQPNVIGGRIFMGTRAGVVYAIDARTGCVYWTFTADGLVRTAVSVGRIASSPQARYAVYFADTRGNTYAVDADTGSLIWKTVTEPHPSTRVTGAPQLYDGRLYVPLATLEVFTAIDPDYRCCTRRGSVVALDAHSGAIVWKTYTIAEEAHPTVVNAAGKQLWGPSGAGVWTTPTIDPVRGLLYVGTGDNNSDPPTATSDAVLALELGDGARAWHYQATADDAWNSSCLTADRSNCPNADGPDLDFASSPVLVRAPGGRRVLLAAQKSGVVHALDPDANGRLLWQVRVGKGGFDGGGIMWGPASDGDKLYVALSDFKAIRAAAGDGRMDWRPDPGEGGGLFAYRISDGKLLWHAPPPACGVRPGCSPAQSAAVSVIPGVVFSGSYDGYIRAYAADTGAVLWAFNTIRDYDTVNGVAGRGGAIDGPGPVVVDGMLYVNSGYARFGAPGGNVLLAFGVASASSSPSR